MVIPREPRRRRGRRRDYTQAPQITKAYLLGIIHDASVRKTTYRVATKNQTFAEILKQGIIDLGRTAWIYKEGKSRNLWIVEFSKSLLNRMKIISREEKLDFVRGFFDAEGGIAKSSKVRFYLYSFIFEKCSCNIEHAIIVCINDPQEPIKINISCFFVACLYRLKDHIKHLHC